MNLATSKSIKPQLAWLFLFQCAFILLFATENYLIAVAVFISLVSMFYIFSGPSNGLVFLPFFLYMPFGFHRLGLGEVHFAAVGSSIIILSFAFFILTPRENSESTFPALAPLLTILLAACLSMINAKYLMASVKDILTYLGFIIFFYSTINFVNTKETILKIFITIIIAGFFAAGLGIFRYLEGHSTRAHGLLGGNFGCFIGISLVMALNFIIFSKNLLYKIISVCTMPLLAVGLVLSQTRAWIAGFAIAVFFIFYNMFKRGSRLKLVLVLLCLVAVTIILMTVEIAPQSQVVSQGAQKAFETGLGEGESLARYVSILMRIFVWFHAFQIYLQNPIFGYGAGNLRIKNYFTGELGAPDAPHVGYIDNHWLHVWFETGILGIIGWIWFAVIIFKASRKLLRLSDGLEWKIISSSLISAVIIYLIGGMFWVTTVDYEMAILLSFLIALIFASVRIIETDKSKANQQISK